MTGGAMRAAKAKARAEEPPAGTDDLWVFAYGSLMWRPGFAYLEARPALLHGHHRALCISSILYRGTPERPGLVMGLDRGGACRGRAFRVAAAEARAVRAYLDARELVTDAYVRRWLILRLAGGARVTAYGFVANRANSNHYRDGLAPEEAAAIVARARGREGTALDYLANTLRHLDEMGIREGPLHRVLAMAKERTRGE